MKIKPENIFQSDILKSDRRKLYILLDCIIPKKPGSKDYIEFKEGDIVEFVRIEREELNPCCGAKYQYFYVLKDTNVRLPIQLAKKV